MHMPRDLCNIVEEYGATLQGVLVHTLILGGQVTGVCTNNCLTGCVSDSGLVLDSLTEIFAFQSARVFMSTIRLDDCAIIRAVAKMTDDTLVAGAADGAVYILNPESGNYTRMLGHSEQVISVASTSDGKPLSGSWDHTARVWDASNGSCLQVLEGHTQPVYAVIGLFDGKMATGSADSTVRVWDTEGHCLHIFKDHEAGVTALAMLPDGALASGSWDQTVRVWDIQQGTCLQILNGHASFVNTLGVAPNGMLVSGDADGIVCIWK